MSRALNRSCCKVLLSGLSSAVFSTPVLLGTVLSCTIVGCAVGPDFSPPSAPMPATWHSVSGDAQGIAPVAGKRPAQEWWKGFDDPLLTSLIERGVAANFDLARAEARLRQARAAVTVERAGFYPQIDVNGEYRRSDSAESFGGEDIHQGSGGARDLFQVGFDAVWELDIFGGTRRRVEAANAGVESAREDTRNVLVTLQAEIASRYITLRGLQKEYDVAISNLEVQAKNVRITRERFDAGFASRFDLNTAEGEVATTSAKLPLLQSQLRQEMFALSVLLGREPSALVEELTGTVPVPLPKGEIPVGLPSELLRRRPDIRQAEANFHAATARIGVATADLFPKFSLSAFFGLEGSSFESLGNWDHRTWSLASSALYPLFDAGRIRATIKIETAAQEEALAQYQQTVLNALKEVESALVALSSEQKRRDSLAAAVNSNRAALEIATKLYTTGLSDFLGVLTVERLLFNSESALAQSDRQIGLAAVALFKSLGGGLDHTPVT